jgi:hypothetical protein
MLSALKSSDNACLIYLGVIALILARLLRQLDLAYSHAVVLRRVCCGIMRGCKFHGKILFAVSTGFLVRNHRRFCNQSYVRHSERHLQQVASIPVQVPALLKHTLGLLNNPFRLQPKLPGAQLDRHQLLLVTNGRSSTQSIKRAIPFFKGRTH